MECFCTPNFIEVNGDKMDILTLKSKVRLGCTRCEKCCIYRGDIRLNPLNICKISKYLYR